MPVLLFLITPSAFAAAPIDITAEIGFAGWVVPDVWVPLRVEVASPVAVHGLVQVTVPPTEYRRAVQLSPGGRQRLTLYVVISDPRAPITVSVRDAGGTILAQRTMSIPRARVVEGTVVALTADPAGLEFLLTGPRRLAGAYVDEDALPDHWAGYEGADLVALRDVDERALSTAQREALRDWVAQGGRLLVTGERILRQHQLWLADLLPADVHPALARPGGLPGFPVLQPIAALMPKAGADRFPLRGPPLVVSRPYGRGVVTVWAFDAFAPDVRSWHGRVDLWEQQLSGGRVLPVARPGLTDVLPTTRTLSGGAQAQIVALAVLYILAVRAVLRRFGSRRGGGWVLVAVALAFTVLAYAVSAAARRSAAATVQMTIVEETGVEDLARVTTYIAMLHPYGGSYALAAPDGSLIRSRAPVRLVSDAGNSVSGDAAPGAQFFEATQMVTLPVHGAVRATADGLHLRVDNTGGAIVSPAVYLNGQMQSLPDIGERLSIALAPAGWRRADRNAATGDLNHDARAWIAAHVDAYRTPAIIGYKTLWLLGEVRDPRLSVRLHSAGEQRGMLLLLLSSITETGGR